MLVYLPILPFLQWIQMHGARSQSEQSSGGKTSRAYESNDDCFVPDVNTVPVSL